MDLEKAIANPAINVFDIYRDNNGEVVVYTYPRPDETGKEFIARNNKNLETARRITGRRKQKATKRLPS